MMRFFAEGARLQLASELACPPVQRQRTLDINGLITAAMMLAIADGIAEQPQFVDHDGTVDRTFVDTGLRFLARQRFRNTAAHGENFHRSTVPSVIPFLKLMS